MNPSLDAKGRRYAYLFSILLVALFVRMLLGLVHPHMRPEQTAVVGLTSVLLAAPTMYRLFHGESLIKPNKRIQYGILSVLTCGMFLYFVALQA